MPDKIRMRKSSNEFHIQQSSKTDAQPRKGKSRVAVVIRRLKLGSETFKWQFLAQSECSFPYRPTLDFASEFFGPVFLGGSHEYLAAGLMRLLQQREQATAAFHVQLAHDVVDQQDRRDSKQPREIFSLRHLEGDGERTFLPLAAELSGRAATQEQLQVNAVRTRDHREI